MAEIADALGNVLNYGTAMDTSDPISVYFVGAGESWNEPGNSTDVSNGWSAYEIQQVMEILGTFEDVADLSFSLAPNASSADFVLSTSDLAGSTIGYFYLPGNYPAAGIGVFDDAYGGWSNSGLSAGGYGYNVILHEIGHGLGLLHPHDGAIGFPAFPGVSGGSDTGDFDLNQNIYTVMSYVDGWWTGPNGISPTYSYGNMATPMALDIAVLQDIYGANTTFESGNTLYTIPTANQVGTGYAAIWDTGGIDTILNPGIADSVLDLRPATLQVEAGGGGYVSYANGIYGGYTIAADVYIENATGGAGQDLIFGNAANNTLLGNAGNDVIVDTLGDDTIDGGTGDDTVEVAVGINAVAGGAGSDFLMGGIQADLLEGGDGNDALQGDPAVGFWGGSDHLVGGNGDDYLMGGLGADTFVFAPNQGSDTIASFTADSVWLGNPQVAVANGADFVSGQDIVELNGFSTAVSSTSVESFLIETGGSTVFSAEGTTINFHGVTGLGADDFIFF